MPFYVKPKELSLGEFLKNNGYVAAFEDSTVNNWLTIIQCGHLPVVVINLGAFKNARIALSKEELAKILASHQDRKVHLVRVDALLPVVHGTGESSSFNKEVRKLFPGIA